MSAANEGNSTNGKKKRRAPGEGMVRQRKADGRWEARITVTQDGQRKPISRYADTEEEAFEALKKMKAARKRSPRAFNKVKTSYLYFIQIGEDGPIKIGRSANVKLRLSDIQASCPYELTLLGVVPEIDDKGEKEVHQYFAAHRVRGEWFEPHSNLVRFIKEHARSLENTTSLTIPPRYSSTPP